MAGGARALLHPGEAEKGPGQAAGARSRQGLGCRERGPLACSPWSSAVTAAPQVKLSAASTTPEQAYLELAAKVLETFGSKDESFVKLAGAMVCWVKCWNAMKA